MPVSSTQPLKEVFPLPSFVAKAKIRYSFSDAAAPYLPYLMLEAAAHVLPTSNTDTDICSAPVEIPGGLPFGDIRTPNLSVRLKELELQCNAHYTHLFTGVRKWCYLNGAVSAKIIPLRVQRRVWPVQGSRGVAIPHCSILE